MGLAHLTVTLDLYDGSGSPVAYGTARFTPSATLTDVADGALITQSPVTASFSPGGFPAVLLLQTDSPHVQPSGWAWQATLNVSGQPPAMQFLLPAGPASFTATNASPCVFTIPGSTGFGTGIPAGTGVTLAGGSLPSGFSAATTYFVVSPSGLTFQLSATQGGSAIASTSTGSGSVTAVSYQLSAVTTVESAALTAQFLPLPTGTPANGNVPVVTATNPLALDWGSGGGGGSGTVTTVSVASANGLAGTVANPTTTPAITLSTSVTGVLKGNGTAISAATPGTDYLAPGGNGSALTGLTVGQVTGAAPSANPTLTGTVTVPTTVNATDAAQKQYVDAVASGLDAKPSVTVLASSNITLSGTQTIDGVAVVAGNRVLCTGQSTSSQNGIWTVASGSWTRPPDFATGSTQLGAYAYTEAGTANASSGWVLVGASPVTVDTSAQSWTQFSGAGEVVAGTGLSKAGNTLSVVPDSTAGHVQPSPGTQAAGAVGVPVDSGHVHGQPPFLAPTAVTGATAAVRYLAGTVSGPPQSGTWAVGDVVPDQLGAIWECVSAGTAPLNGQFRRLGDHAYQFRVECYGALGNGKVVTDAVMTSGSPNLACTTSTPFASGDVGKHVLVSTAAGTYAHLHSTISTFTDSGHVILAANATANTGGTPGAIMYYGSDDTAAIQAAINAATAYASSHNGYGEVVFGNKVYIIAGAFTVGGVTLGNFQLGLPIVVPGSATQVVLMLRGAMEATPLMHWLQLQPQFSGTVLASVRTDGTDDATYGPACVIGGPVSTYGHEPGTFSNALIKVRGVGILLPYNATMGGIDCFGMVEADVDTLSVMTAAVVPTSSAPAPSMATTGNISNQWTFGYRPPDTGNQVVCRVGQISVQGLCYGLCPSEWTLAEDVHVMYCIIAVAPYSQSATEAHSALILEVQAENCGNALGPASWASVPVARQIAIDIVNLQGESLQHPIYDPSPYLQGDVGARLLGYGGYNANWFQSGGGNLLRLTNKLNAPGPVASPNQPVTGGGTAWVNYYYQPAWIEANVSGGTFTSLTTSRAGTSVAQPGAVGAASYRFMLASGASYTPALSAGTVTHTVELL